MDVGARRARKLTEVALGEIRVVASPLEAAAFDQASVLVHGVEIDDADLDIDDWLGGQAGNSGGTHVVDPFGETAQRAAKLLTQRLELVGPRRVVRGNRVVGH